MNRPFEHWLDVRGARTHNLRSVDLRFPHGILVAFTGRSGAGKSSLAVDTIMSEAHRRTVQSMSAYVRQFTASYSKPAVDYISGLCSTIFLDQARINRNPRSTLGTSTDIFDLLRVLFGRFGRMPCPVCAEPMNQPDGPDLGCRVHPDEHARRLDPKDFSFNLPFGACPECDGMGTRLRPDVGLVVPDVTRSVRDGAISGFNADRFADVHHSVAAAWCEQHGLDSLAPWSELPAAARSELLTSTGAPVEIRNKGIDPWQTTYVGPVPWLEQEYRAANSDAARARIGAFMVESACAECSGSRLGSAQRAYRVGGRGLAEICALTLEDCALAVSGLPDDAGRSDAAAEISQRLGVLIDLGVGYLSLDRSAPSLSGGEAQRIRLGAQLTARLFGLMYVLDEPSAGLHPRDIDRLVSVLRDLRDYGNTVLVVEHDRQVIQASDWIVDVGPGAGKAGGRVLYSGPTSNISASTASITGPYLTANSGYPQSRPTRRRAGVLGLRGASARNIINLDVDIPLGVRVALTGVSGSGKSTLVREILLPALRSLGVSVPSTTPGSGRWREVTCSGAVERVIVVDQAPIGRSSRSNPATYCGFFDDIRKVFAALPDAKAAKLTAKHFSFNLPDGRCPACSGEGVLRIEMQFLPDAVIPCEDCAGTRYQDRVLAIRRGDLSIADILDLSVDEAVAIFDRSGATGRALATMSEIGLGYLKLGQPAPSLSGGEAQRLKIATELCQPAPTPTLYILDEPTTGLHMSDIAQVTATMDRLVADRHSVLVIEHDPDLITTSDWVIDIGPGGGPHGGVVVASGTPEQVGTCDASITGHYLGPTMRPRSDSVDRQGHFQVGPETAQGTLRDHQ